jgi:hypothetical protein
VVHTGKTDNPESTILSGLTYGCRLNGIVPTAFQLNDQRLLGDIGRWVSYIVAHQAPDGWIGPESNPRVFWGTYPALLALRV